MGKRMKSYLIFTGLGYRIILFAVVPILLTLFGFLLSAVFDFPGYFLAVYLLPAIEISMDTFVFGGIASKEMVHLEYLKTSTSGSGLMKNALQGGIIRMLISNAVILFINYLIYHGRTGDIWNAKRLFTLLWFFVLIYVVTIILIVIARFFVSEHVNYTLGFVSFLLEMFAIRSFKNLYVSFVILIMIAVTISVFSVKLVEKRIKESYYDKTAKDGI